MIGESEFLRLLIAALGGTAVGLERQWSGHADGPAARFGGLRTFTMLGAVAGLSGWLWISSLTLPAAILLAGAVAIVAAAYAAASRQDIDATTEVAALVVLAAGFLAGTGALRLASGIVALTCLLLVEKSRLHALVRRFDDIGLRAAARFAVMALVVLPLLPEGPFGPAGGVRPRALWALVLFFSGLSFLGYLARRLVGPGHGYLLAGLLGGLISSTNVTFTFARSSRIDPAMARALAFGTVAANAVLYPRVLVALAVLNGSLVMPAIPYVAPPALLAALIAAIWRAWSARASVCGARIGQPAATLRRAPDGPAVSRRAVRRASRARDVGASGVLTSAAVLGLTDVDALTMSMARDVAYSVSPDVAALAIAIGILANTALKLGIALVFGSRRFRRIAGISLGAMIVAAAVPLVLRWR